MVKKERKKERKLFLCMNLMLTFPFNDREDFLWGYSVFSSRAFPYTLIDSTSTDQSEVLFPLVDALNHKPNTKITWSRTGDADTGSLSFIAGQVFNTGDEIFNNYGPKVIAEISIKF
jgi:hypothetical protein